MEYRDAPQRIVGVNEGVKLLQRFIIMYKPTTGSNVNTWSHSGASAFPTPEYRVNNNIPRPGGNFFTQKITPSSNNTAICVKFLVYSSGMQNIEFWYNSWGKDITGIVRLDVASTYYTVSVDLPDNSNISDGLDEIPSYSWNSASLPQPYNQSATKSYVYPHWMKVEEWENGDPNHPQVKYWTDPGHDGVKSNQTHPMNHQTGKTYVMNKEFNSDYANQYTMKKDGQHQDGVPFKGELNKDGGYD